MDAIADLQTGLEGQAVSDGSPTAPTADGPEEGEAGSPYLTLDGFTGPLDHLLTLARAQKIDIAGISLTALIDQLTTALRQAPAATSLGEKGDWVVMAAWLVQLRTRLLLPADAPGQQEAAAEADQLRASLAALEDVQALAQWLERQPQLGHDAFARGRPEMFGVSVEAGPAIDMAEFLWASLALFDDEEPLHMTTAYRPATLTLHTVAEARARILQRLSEQPDGATLQQLLPQAGDPSAPVDARAVLRRRSAWSSTLMASLELARQGVVVLEQGEDFKPIHVVPANDPSPP
jgi:segregation and condensation protein A